MPTIFLDTSAFLKLYITEAGSGWLQTFVGGQQKIISELVLFECATALRRRYIEGSFTELEAIDLFGQIRRDASNYQVISVGTDFQLSRMGDLVFNLPTTLRIRALDGLHLTAASIALDVANSLTPPEPFVFVSSDRQLLQVAQARGFTSENPEDYP